MIIKINGKDEVIDKKLDLAQLIEGKKLCPDNIVIQHNTRIVPKEEWKTVFIKESDSIEIISFMGGG